MCAENKNEETIFNAAIQLKDAAERDAYLSQTCGDNRELRGAIEELLEHHDVNSFLDVPPVNSDVTLDDSAILEGPGTVIGRYKLLERIGEGGMAVVYMAEQKRPIRRRVALKLIKLGMDTKQVIARFEAERQALAMMDHPNIAKVLDAGSTDTGRPYFVMELVKGVSITKYCDMNKLSTKDRLGLFISVCNAVQHAHQKGIIHRDIKPSNVMVTLRDGTAAPKVIDFGIAKATNQKLTEKTLFTRYAHIIGTPAYMSPEQAELSELDVDTRTDIYSLGVLLYELLTGATPFEAEKLREAGYVEMQRIIREEEPAKPSTKLSTMGETLTDIAEHRKTNPDLLTKLIRGDLDWIVMKSLEKDRTRRYDTAVELAADVERHLRNEPVQAAAPSVSYRLRKFVRRNRAGLIAGSMVVAALIIGTLVSTLGFIQAKRQRDLAEANLRTAESQRQRAEDNFSMSLDAVDEMLKVAKLSLNEHLRFEFAQKPPVNNPELEEMRQAILQKAQMLYEEFLKKNSTDPTARMETARAYYRTAHIHQELRQYDQAVPAYRNAINTYEKLSDELSSGPGFREDLSKIRHKLAIYYYDLCWALKEAERVDEAEQLYWQAMRLFEELAVDFANVDKEWERFADMGNAVGIMRINAGQLEAAEKILRRGNELAEQFAEHYPTSARYRRNLAQTLGVLGGALSMAGQSEEAERIWQKGLVACERAIESDPNNSDNWHGRGAIYFSLGQFDKAIADYTKAIELDPNNSDYWHTRGYIYFGLGQFDKAIADYTKAIELDPSNADLRRLRAEAAERLGISEQPDGKEVAPEKIEDR